MVLRAGNVKPLAAVRCAAGVLIVLSSWLLARPYREFFASRKFFVFHTWVLYLRNPIRNLVKKSDV